VVAGLQQRDLRQALRQHAAALVYVGSQVSAA
jgi:hypothetical protein